MTTYNQYGLNTVNKTGHDLPLQYVPSNQHSPGIAPAGPFIVAPYLPRLRRDVEKFVYIVISSGKVVAFDKAGFVVPAGLKLEAEAYAAALVTSVAAADAQALVRYSSIDVAEGQKNYKGVAVVANEPVVKSWFTGSTQNNFVSYYAGVAFQNVYQHAGGDNHNPATLNYTNFNPQPTFTILCDYHMQYPVVADAATIRGAALTGIAGIVADPSEYTIGSFITYDRESNFVPANPTGDLHGYGSTDPEAILGQVTGQRIFKNATTGAIIESDNYLDKVVAPNAATASVLNEIPNALNGGMPTFVTYSSGYGVVQFGLHFR